MKAPGRTGPQARHPEYVTVAGLPDLRFMTDATPAGDGFVWLRPAFIAMRVPAYAVIPWSDDDAKAGP